MNPIRIFLRFLRRMPPLPHRAVLYIAAVLPFSAVHGSPADDSLFSTTDENPLIQLYSLPSPALYAAPGAGGWGWRFDLDIANSSIEEELPSGERIVFDGETYRSSLTLSRGLSDRISAGLTIPFVAHSGGFLDSLVRDWHDLFGLSNSRRNQFEDDSLDYHYEDGAGEEIRIVERSRGVGDVRLALERRLGAAASPRRLALRAGLKLPTGSSDNLHGSGSTDASLQLLATDNATLAAWDTTLAWMVGGLWLGDGDVLDGLRRDVVAIGSVGVSRPMWRGLTLRLQLDGHSSFYDTRLEPLGAASVQITFGGSIAVGRAGRVDLAMIENLFTDTTPDLVFHVAWRGAL